MLLDLANRTKWHNSRSRLPATAKPPTLATGCPIPPFIDARGGVWGRPSTPSPLTHLVTKLVWTSLPAAAAVPSSGPVLSVLEYSLVLLFLQERL
jgi:hypothetical protein